MFLDLLKSLFNAFYGTSAHHTAEQQPDRPTIYHEPSSHSTGRGDLNQINQRNPYYVDLRERANIEGREMAKCFEESHLYYSRGDKAGAKILSNEGKEHQRKMERLNKEASDWIFSDMTELVYLFIENNKHCKSGEIDLHGLYVKEALERTEYAIQDAKADGTSEVRLIVGKGLHSGGGSAKIRPAVEELMQKHHLVAALDIYNPGVLIVQINSDGNEVLGANDISRHLERDEGCIIM